jgi:hypothetical protein
VILFEDKKVAFLFPAKTGSTTVVNYLNHSCLQKTIHEERHLFLDEALKIFPQIEDYKIYCFLRNPVKRFASYLMMSSINQPIKNLIQVFKSGIKESYFDFINAYFNKNKYLNSYDYRLSAHQIRYFNKPNVVALDFDNFEFELKSASKNLELSNALVRHNAKGSYELNGIDKQEFLNWLLPFVKTEYADDCDLWQEKFGRKIDHVYF